MKRVPFFFQRHSYKVDPNKTSEYYNFLKTKYLSLNQNHTEQEITDFTNEFLTRNNENPVIYICGKHLYHSLFYFLKNEKQLSKIPSKDGFMKVLFVTMIDNNAKTLFNFIS